MGDYDEKTGLCTCGEEVHPGYPCEEIKRMKATTNRDYDAKKILSDIKDNTTVATIEVPEYSKWSCYLFGSTNGNGIVWKPLKGQEPNWFWRKMQFLVFGNKWEKNDE